MAIVSELTVDLLEPVTQTRAFYRKAWGENTLCVYDHSMLAKLLIETPYKLQDIVWTVIHPVYQILYLYNIRADFFIAGSWKTFKQEPTCLKFGDIWPKHPMPKPLELFEMVDNYRNYFDKWLDERDGPMKSVLADVEKGLDIL